MALLIAVVAVALAGLVRYALTPILGIRSPFMIFIVGVALAAWRGGWRAGITAIPIAAFIVVVFIDPIQANGSQGLVADMTRVAMFCTVCGVVLALVNHLQTERAHLAMARSVLEDMNLQLESRVQDRTESLVRANGELQAITHAVAHDVRAPLRAIIANSAILQQDYANALDAEGLAILDRQRTNALRLSDLIDKMLEYARVSKAVLRIVEFDLAPVARDIAADLTNRYGKDHSISFSISDRMVIRADQTLMGSVLENLMENACKYSGDREILIRVKMKRQGDCAAVIVDDNGEGFDPQYSEKIFEPFHRLHSYSKVEGTGTGLANVRRIVELHGGKVTAESKGEGKGARFILCLPMSESVSMTA